MTRIEICGGIATGKTTLARSLTQDPTLSLVREKYYEVPFWKKFYDNPTQYAFGKNAGFLLFHADAIDDHKVANAERVVCDFAMFQDLAYASLSSEKDELTLIENMYHRLAEQVGPPSAIVHLKCMPKTQLKRIAQRGRKSESQITEQYLGALSKKIDERLNELIRPRAIPVLSVDTDQLDFVTNPELTELRAWLGAQARRNITPP